MISQTTVLMASGFYGPGKTFCSFAQLLQCHLAHVLNSISPHNALSLSSVIQVYQLFPILDLLGFRTCGSHVAVLISNDQNSQQLYHKL